MIRRWLEKRIEAICNARLNSQWFVINNIMERLVDLENKPQSLANIHRKLKVTMLDKEKSHTFVARRSSNGRFAKKSK